MQNDEFHHSSFIIHHSSLMDLDTTRWSGDGDFTARLIEALRGLPEVALLRVEDAPATRAESTFSFISNELFVAFTSTERKVRTRKLGFIPASAVLTEKSMTLAQLEAVLTSLEDVGAPDYSDDGMLQYLRTQRIIPPYQTRGVKLVELVRIYEMTGQAPPGVDPRSAPHNGRLGSGRNINDT
jgi:hypothetical protein